MNHQKHGCSYLPLPSQGIDTRRDSGDESREARFERVWNMVMANYQTFSAQDFYSFKGLDLEPQEIKSLAEKHIRKALKSGHIVLLQSVDQPVFQVV